MEITEELYAAWYEWVCKGNRNPFGDLSMNEDRINYGKSLAYWSYWDNASDIKRVHLTDFDIERMEEDPNADGIHWGAMEAAKDWERSALAAIEDGREPEDHWL
jgi:hypothetical protein